MTQLTLLYLLLPVSMILGIYINKFLQSRINNKQLNDLEEQKKLILKEAELSAEKIKNEKILQSKETFLKMKEEFDEEINKRKNLMAINENRVKQREVAISKQSEQLKRKMDELDASKENLNAQLEIVNKRKEEYNELKNKQISLLEKVSQLSSEEAKKQLTDVLIDEAQTSALAKIKDIVTQTNMTATKEAKKIIIQTIQRTATENAIENCVSVFNLENDELKGKIIGREGRNIRTLESVTGVELIIDDTPEAIVISGYDPVRREIARLSLHRLVQDGRIHPARIEQIVEQTKKNIEDEIIEIGERTVIDLGIHGLHPELVRMVGRMRFRSSYGQNLLQHSREVARMCATMASELGLNAKLAKRAGLLHDIGKVSVEEPELPHALLGMELAQKYKEHPEICNAIGAHHDEIPMTSIISPIIQSCDAISGSRPGARREMVEAYIKRLQDLEKMAMEFDGVKKCFAIHAGRELRVIVDAASISDTKVEDLSFQISHKIEKQMQYPGQIKVTVIRETRSVAYAK